MVKCACGCGEEVIPPKEKPKKRFVYGHNNRGVSFKNRRRQQNSKGENKEQGTDNTTSHR